jgi:diphosphomevalonate decarboxylase
MEIQDRIVTATASSNIALIKYWTKRDNILNLPNNSSISMTLDAKVSTRTSVMFTDEIDADKLYINGESQNLGKSSAPEKLKFINDMLNYMKDLADTEIPALVVSKNNFPMSSGMASSASGAAALVFALNEALGLKLNIKELSVIARRISGSACRSMYGGIVKWNKGSVLDGSDSYAEQIVPRESWPGLLDIIAIVDSSKKKISSSDGHRATANSSVLVKSRYEFAEKGVEKVINAVNARDLAGLAEAAMKDSNNMHATMLDTYPPIIYLTDASRDIIYAVHELNKSHGVVAGYTFDAGPNAHIITTTDHKDKVLKMLHEIRGVEDVIESGVGDGPRLLSEEHSLIDKGTLRPSERS